MSSMYGEFGRYWVLNGGTFVYNRTMCVSWERDANGKLMPKGFEAGFATEREAWNYLFDNRPADAWD